MIKKSSSAPEIAENKSFLICVSMPQCLTLALDSSSSSFFFNLSPAENPPSEPAELITRCQGMMIGMGLAPNAWPTARTAFGFFILLAIQA